MADNTKDTNSEIEKNPAKLYTPRFHEDGTPISGDVELGGVHDISKDSKKTIGDFMSRVTKGEAGSAGKANAFAVKGDITQGSLTDPSTGLPAHHTNDQVNEGSSDQIKTAGTTIGSFINTVDEQAKANFNNLSVGDFNNAEGVPGLASKEDKNSQKFGHTVHSDIEAIPSTSTRLGAPSTFSGTEGSEVQQKISAVLKSNRFNSSNSTPFMQDNAPDELGFTKQTELGKYVPNGNMVPFSDIKKIGHQMVVASTGHAADTESMTVAGILPTVEQITGLSTIDTQDLRPRAMPAAGSITENKGELITGESDHDSYGHLSSPVEPFADALPVGMFVNTIAGMAALLISAKAITALLGLFEPDSTGTSLKPGQPFNLRKGRHASKKPTATNLVWDMLKVPTVEYDFAECMYLGILTFYGVNKVPGVGAPFNINDLLESAKNVAQSPGYYNGITRAVLRGAESVVEATSDIPFSPDAVLQLFNVVETITASTTWKFFMEMTRLGNQVRMAIDGHPRMDDGNVDAFQENATSRVKMSRASLSAGGPFYPGSQGQGRLAWRHASAPARYLLPMSFIRASGGAGKRASFDIGSNLAAGIGGKPYATDLEDGKSNLGSGKKFEGTTDPNSPSRLSKEYVKYIEDGLDAEYMPFYFHDLRTNEIISFHAFLGGYTDGFSTDYTSVAGYGRADEVKIYNKTTRSISFDFTVAATSPQDLDVMYWNINKLVSMCYPQWSRGRKMTNGEDDKFIQPFSQIPTASPMIRVRIGDMVRSNYSKFGLMRAFGLGNSPDEFNIDQKEDNDKKRQKKVAEATEQANVEAEKVFKSKEMFGFQDRGASSGTGFGNAISSLQGGPTPSPEPEFGYAVGDFVMLDPTPTKYWPRTSDAKMGKEQNPSIGPDKKEGRLHAYPTQVEVEVVKRIPGYNVGPAGFDTDVAEHERDPYEDPGIGELVYLVKIAEASPAHDSLGSEIDTAFLHHRAEHSEIVGLSPKGRQRIIDALLQEKIDAMGDVPEGMDGPERLKNFFDADKNFIVRSFESSGGRGLAGFITGLNFDWAESTWEIDPGRRAPKMVKLSVSFAPIHDLHLGLDHDGMMTSVPFNVGKMSNAIGHDPWDETSYPSDSTSPGNTNITAADGKTKKKSPAPNSKLEAAKKLADFPSLPFP